MSDIGEIRARLVLNSDNFNRNMQNARDEMTSTGRAAQRTSQDISRIQTASLAVGAAIVSGLGAAAAVSIDFEAQMSRVKGIVGASETEFEKLKDAALELGASTSMSASQVSIAFEDMAAKGFNATQIIEAMPGVIAAAEASGSDLALTADVVASALNGFGLEAAEASRVADILAKTANISAAGMEDMAYAFKYVGPVAHSLGMDIEEVSAAIGIMTNAGLDGSSAGTALRQAILSLNNPAKAQAEIMKEIGFSMQDSNGEAKSLSAMFADLTEATKGMTQAEKVATVAKLVGTEASSGMLAVMENGVDQLNEFTDSLKNSTGASKEAAAIMKDNVKASFDEFAGSLESLSIELTDDMLPAFREVIQYGTKIVNSLSEMDGATVKSGLAFAGTAASIGLVLSSIGKLGIAMRAFTMTPLGAAITGLSILGGLLVAAKVESDAYNEATMERINEQYAEAKALDELTVEYDGLRNKLQLSNAELSRYLDIQALIKQTADPAIVTALKDEQEKLRVKSGLSADELQRFLDVNKKIVDEVPSSNVVLTEQGRIFLENADAAKALTKEKYEQLRLDLEIEKNNTMVKMKDELIKQESLQKSINDLYTKRQDNIQAIADKEQKVAEAQRALQEAKDEGDKLAIFRAEGKLQVESDQLDVMRIHHGKLLEEIQAQEKSLEKVNKKVGKLDQVNQKMVELELRMVGINAKHGEELKAIDSEIAKLDAKKKKLQETTPIAGRNTDEYREAVGAIQNQIDKLQGAKNKVEEIIGRAGAMNAELGKAINKNITVNTRNIETTIANTNRGRYGSPRENYHVGGIVGSVPKLHVGGLAAQFASMPNHNEIDTRLLRDEMVLTQAQQANLFRMIDAGMTGKSGDAITFTDPALVAAIKELAARPVSVQVDGREIAEASYPHINSRTTTELNTKFRVNGIK